MTTRTISRRTFARGFVAASALTTFGAPAIAQRAKYRLRYGTAFPADHPGATRIQEAAPAIAKDTSGAKSTCRSIRTASSAASPTCSRRSAPARSTSCRPPASTRRSCRSAASMRWPSRSRATSKVWAAMDGDLGAYVRAQFEQGRPARAAERCSTTAIRNITTGAKPINTPEDLKGLKIRVPGNQLWVTMFNDARRRSDPDQFRRTLRGAADPDRRRPGESAGADLQRQALRGPEVRRPDRPHLGRPLHLRQRQEVERAAGGGPRRDHDRA